jgi:4-amino-4-deoxy-L-arabinose transferase-like glycosyltransferase
MNRPASNTLQSMRVGDWYWLALWFVLLLPLAVLFPPIPIDETRYLTAAWEMFNSGQWLVPTVNGAWYSDKSPLLFWLIAGGWKVFGVHTWVARVEALIIALAMLLMVRRLVARLHFEERGADAMWLLAGCAGFALFATAIMFDLLLALTVLGALHALLDLDARRYGRGIALLGLWIGFGMLAKGPVVLLHIAGLAVLAPLWSESAGIAKARWYLSLLAGVLIGIAIIACWLIPAALYAGPDYWQPLVGKVTGRLHESFAHGRPFWWYLPLIPVLLLPWVIALRAPLRAWRILPRGRAGTFLLCWWLPPLIAFCAISGKQIHYLAPLLPAWALSGAYVLRDENTRVRGGPYALFALLIAIGLCLFPGWAARTYGYPLQRSLLLFALVALVIAAGVWRAWGRDARSLALAATALASVSLLAGALALRPALDVRPEAAFVASALRAHVPIAHIEWHNGLFGYTGRLHQSLPVIARAQVLQWCHAHPNGWLLVSDRSDEPEGVAPARAWPYFLSGSKRIGAWRAADILKTKR